MVSSVAPAAAETMASFLESTFDDLEKQRALITSCTRLWKELTDHFSSLEKDLQLNSESLMSKIQTLDQSTEKALDSLRRREESIDGSVEVALEKVEERREAAVRALAGPDPPGDDGLVRKLRALCTKMDAGGFWDLLVTNRKDTEAVRSELPVVIEACVDPARFAIDAISHVFPEDKRSGKAGANDYGWACVMILESLVPVVADPELGSSRPLVTPSMKKMAKRIIDSWKEGMEQRGGIEGMKPPDVHTFLQLVVTFDIVNKEDKEFYWKLVVSSSWRKQMPRLALSLGLGDIMTDIIDELINKGQQLDAVNFAYEAGLVEKYPPVPLLKAYLETSKKAASSILEDRNNSGRATHLAGRKEQSALRAVLKCIEDRKLQSEFPPESLQKRLAQLEKVKVEKRKPATVPANKRTRANSGGPTPMPPAKAGRLTNHAHVPSFSSPTYVRSPSHASYHVTAPPYAYDNRSGVPSPYGSQSPPSMRDPYPYRHEDVVAPCPLPISYTATTVNYPVYAGYGNCFATGYQQAYYM